MYANTLTWTTSGKKKANQESRKLYGWGVPFPSPKSVQNEHFYIILLAEKVVVTLFQFWDASPCTQTVWEKKTNQESRKLYGWGVPFPSPKSVQNEHVYIILLAEKVAVALFQFWDESPCTQTP